MTPPPKIVGDAPYPKPLYAWTVVFILFGAAILSYTDRQVLSLLVDPIRSDLHLGDTAMSLLLGTAFALIYGAAGIPLGFVADRTSRRNLILAGVLVWGLGTVLCGLAHSFAALFAARAVVGLGEAALSPAAISLISDYFPPSRRGSAVGLYFTGIAIGVGGSIFIGGAVLHGVSAGLMSATPFATWPPWRLVLLIIAAPSLLWGVLVLAIREPTRRLQDAAAEDDQAAATGPSFTWKDLVQTAPLYGVAAIASLVDNAVGAWAPSLMIRRFRVDPARVGIDLGLLLMLGYGGGMLLGGLLADMARARRGRRGKVELCLVAALAILPVSLLIDAANLTSAMVGVPLYFFLSAVVTASGLSAILDASPNRVRGAVMAVSFFLNVAIGAGFGPTAVSLAGDHLFGAAAGLGPAIAFTVAAAYAVAAAAACLALGLKRSK